MTRSKRPRAGDLRHLVQVQSKSTALDSYGQVSNASTDWTGATKMRGMIEPLSGNEGELARQRYPNATHRFVTDYSSTFAATGATGKRLRFGTRFFNILEIRNTLEESFRMEMTIGEER